jgi:hypothetical protein
VQVTQVEEVKRIKAETLAFSLRKMLFSNFCLWPRVLLNEIFYNHSFMGAGEDASRMLAAIGVFNREDGGGRLLVRPDSIDRYAHYVIERNPDFDALLLPILEAASYTDFTELYGFNAFEPFAYEPLLDNLCLLGYTTKSLNKFVWTAKAISILMASNWFLLEENQRDNILSAGITFNKRLLGSREKEFLCIFPDPGSETISVNPHDLAELLEVFLQIVLFDYLEILPKESMEIHKAKPIPHAEDFPHYNHLEFSRFRYLYLFLMNTGIFLPLGESGYPDYQFSLMPGALKERTVYLSKRSNQSDIDLLLRAILEFLSNASEHPADYMLGFEVTDYCKPLLSSMCRLEYAKNDFGQYRWLKKMAPYFDVSSI